MSENNIKVAMAGINKSFPGGVIANRDVAIEIRKGEIHAIVGENGAGKSTLMNILYGLVQPDSGQIKINDRIVEIDNPRVAKNHGIGMVHQHFMLVPSFSVLQNVILGYEPRWRKLFVDRNRAANEVSELCNRYHLHIPLHAPVNSIPVGLQQRIEIIKSIYRGAEVLILDEPTAVLTPLEVTELFVISREMTQQGKTILFISHKLKEVLGISDRVTVMCKGQSLETLITAETNEKELANLIIGCNRFWSFPKRTRPINAKLKLEINQLSVRSQNGTLAVNNLSLQLHHGEILGVASVEGNGQCELAAALAGLLPALSGTIHLDGQNITTSNVAQRRALGLRHIPEDRNSVGLCMDGTIAENMVIDPGNRVQFIQKSGLINWNQIATYTRNKIEEYNIIAESEETLVGNLSGGNMQKVVAARELMANQHCLLVLHPTRGLDIGASQFIYQRLLETREKGSGILLFSADLDEIFLLSDRIVVLYEGRIAAEFLPNEVTPELIGLYMTGAKTGVERIENENPIEA